VDHDEPFHDIALPVSSPTSQKVLDTQETELGKFPSSNILGLDHDEPFQVDAMP
jgi:hypothetical protein